MNENWQLAMAVGIGGNLLALAAAALIFREPPGSAVRPMDIPIYLLFVAIATAGLGLPVSGIAIFKDRKQRVLALIAAVLCVAPLFTGFLAFHGFVNAFGYVLKP